MLSARNLKPVPNARKKVYTVPITGNYATGTKHRKHATGTKRGESCPLYRTRENMQLVFKQGKSCTLYKARENMQPVPSAGKTSTGTKHGKTVSYWLINVRDCFDHVTHLKTLRARENILTWSFFAFVRG